MPFAHADVSDVPSWIPELFAAIDAQDANAFGEFLTENAGFTFGNAPTVKGRLAVIGAVTGFFESISALSHRLTRVMSQADMVMCCGEVEYTRHDGNRVTVPFADTFVLQADRISDYRIYMDISPVYASAE